MTNFMNVHELNLKFLKENLDAVHERNHGIDTILVEPYRYGVEGKPICMPDLIVLYNDGSINMLELKHSHGLYTKARKQLLSAQEWCERELPHRVIQSKKVVYYHDNYWMKYEAVDHWKVASDYPFLTSPSLEGIIR